MTAVNVCVLITFIVLNYLLMDIYNFDTRLTVFENYYTKNAAWLQVYNSCCKSEYKSKNRK